MRVAGASRCAGSGPRCCRPRRPAAALPGPGRRRSCGASSSACSSALVALGLALIYRANRIINFAQTDLGSVPTIARRLPDRLLGAGTTGRGLGAGLLAAAGGRRPRRAGDHPPLLRRPPAASSPWPPSAWPRCWGPARCSCPGCGASGPSAQALDLPWDIQLHRSTRSSSAPTSVAALIVAPLVMVALAVFLRRTDVGVAVRAVGRAGRPGRAARHPGQAPPDGGLDRRHPAGVQRRLVLRAGVVGLPDRRQRLDLRLPAADPRRPGDRPAWSTSRPWPAPPSPSGVLEPGVDWNASSPLLIDPILGGGDRRGPAPAAPGHGPHRRSSRRRPGRPSTRCGPSRRRRRPAARGPGGALGRCRRPRRRRARGCRPGCRPATRCWRPRSLIFAHRRPVDRGPHRLGRPGLARPDGRSSASGRRSAGWPPRSGASTSAWPCSSAGFAGAVAAVLVGLPALRLQGLLLSVTTFALRPGDVLVLPQPPVLRLDPRPGASSASRSSGASTTTRRRGVYYVILAVLVAGHPRRGAACGRSRFGRVLDRPAGERGGRPGLRAAPPAPAHHRLRHLGVPGRGGRRPVRPPPAGLRPGHLRPLPRLPRLHDGGDRRPRLDARRRSSAPSTSS